MSKSLHLPSRILKVYIENLIGLSDLAASSSSMHTLQTASTTHYSLEAASLQKAPTVRTVSRTHIPRTRMRVRSLQLPESSSRVTSGHNLSMTSFNAQTRRDDMTIKWNTIGYRNRKKLLAEK